MDFLCLEEIPLLFIGFESKDKINTLSLNSSKNGKVF